MSRIRPTAVLVALSLVLLAPAFAAAQEVAVEVFKKLAPSVVKFVSSDGEGIGTGFVIHPGGLVMTNVHVVASPMRYHVEVEYRDASGAKQVATFKKVDAKFRRHPDYDCAIVRIDPSEHAQVPLVPVAFLDDEVLPGMSSFAIGHPLGGSKSISVGNISSVGYKTDEEELPHTMSTSIVQGGNSGGPVVDSQGRVMGIATFFRQDPRGGSALTGCVPREAWRDFAKFTAWESQKADAKAASRFEKIGDRILEQAEEFKKTAGDEHPMVREMMAAAAQMYQRALAESPSDPRLLVKFARMLIKYEQGAKAANMLVEAIDARPWEGGDAYGLLALALLDVKDAEDSALIAAEEGVAKFPKNPLVWVARGAYFGDKKKDWVTAVLYGNVGWDLSDSAESQTKQMVTSVYFAAKSKLTEAGGREPHHAEVKAILEEEVKTRAEASDKAKKDMVRYITPAFEKIVARYKPEPPPAPPTADLAQMMAEYSSGAVATPIPNTPGTTPPTTIGSKPPITPPTPLKPVKDKDAEWLESKMGLARMYWTQKDAKPEFKDMALKVLKQIDYRFPNDPRGDEARKLHEMWSKE